MNEFNRMTIVAAAEVVGGFKSHSDMEILEVQWNIQDAVSDSSKPARVASWARIAADTNPMVMINAGEVRLERAIVETALCAPPGQRSGPEWLKLLAGLRFDGFELIEVEVNTGRTDFMDDPVLEVRLQLSRMLPENVPGTDFRQASSEVEVLLDELQLPIAKGHLSQALSAFQRGDWSSANGQLRNFYENYLNEIANGLGYSGQDTSKARRDFLGAGLESPFLLEKYNEWHPQKTQFVQGLMNRLHPEGGHLGLSEQEDATFRLQISLVTARLFLRRYKRRLTN